MYSIFVISTIVYLIWCSKIKVELKKFASNVINSKLAGLSKILSDYEIQGGRLRAHEQVRL